MKQSVVHIYALYVYIVASHVHIRAKTLVYWWTLARSVIRTSMFCDGTDTEGGVRPTSWQWVRYYQQTKIFMKPHNGGLLIINRSTYITTWSLSTASTVWNTYTDRSSPNPTLYDTDRNNKSHILPQQTHTGQRNTFRCMYAILRIRVHDKTWYTAAQGCKSQ